MQRERENGKAAAGLLVRRRQAIVARFLAVLYAVASLIAAGHHHDGTSVSSASATRFAASAHTPQALAHAATHLDADERDCAICDFIAHLVSPTQPVALPTSVVAVVALASPENATAVFFPARFCDRSAARAPPVVRA